ncbi:MAG: Omega-amino acid--pyruvate aminotransferase, partial [Pseudomonadota bacterium]
LFARAAGLADHWARAAHALCDAPHVIDIRTIGLVAAVELAPRPDAPGQRAMDIFHAAFDAGLLIRVTGDIVALSPPLIISGDQIDELFGTLRALISAAK